MTLLNVRFDSASVMVYGGWVIVQVKMLSLYHKNIDWRQKFRPFTEFYASDLPWYKALEAQLDLWEACWLNDNISSKLKSNDFKSFSNIKVCLIILGTLSVTKCTCEWSFYSVRRFKTHTHSTTISERLNGIALIHVHQEIVPDTEKIIDAFAVRNRRLNFI